VPELATQRDAIDSTIAKAARADSLDELLADKLETREVEFVDTLDFNAPDSAGSFRAIEIHSLEYDPMTDLMTKVTKYLDVNFNVREKTIERIIVEPMGFFEKIQVALPEALVFLAVIETVRFWISGHL
jgi:hypothetical protein